MQLSKDEVLHAFDGTGLVCKDMGISSFDGFPGNYRRSGKLTWQWKLDPFEDVLPISEEFV